ncbi:MAG: vanadium-dependent haloperoxidase [Ginsengibacter sp.]
MNSRQDRAKAVRYSAAEVAYNRIHPLHISSGDEQRYRRKKIPGLPGENVPSLLNSFTKGLSHDMDGFVVDTDDFEAFIRASDSGDIDVIADLPLAKAPADQDIPTTWQSNIANTAKGGAPAVVRGWESMGTGQTFELEGPDPQAMAIPPAPKLWSDELASEMVELYWMTLVRDVPFTKFDTNPMVGDAIKHLNKLDWIKTRSVYGLKDYEIKRKRGYFVDNVNDAFNGDNIFRGNIKGDDVGFHISQFLYVGTNAQGKGNPANIDTINFDASEGLIQYGSCTANQRVRICTPKKDYMTNWSQWIDNQNAADVRGLESYGDLPGANHNAEGYRFIWTPRDLATFVHYDALHQAYFNACIIMLDLKIPFDPGLPFRGSDAIDKQIGFATFGGPHILTLVSEVAARALKAVRFQKYSVHRRARPEQLAGFIDRYKTDSTINGIECMKELIDKMNANAMFNKVKAHNANQNTRADRSTDPTSADNSWLLPMPFVEGSPMHPSYGSGHATVAGACVTILKAFFDSGYILPFSYKPSNHGRTLVHDAAHDNMYTVEGELNKLAGNIAFGRNWGGVHWYSDQLESLRLGEQMALGILEEQKLTYGENFSMSIPLFDGTTIRI